MKPILAHATAFALGCAASAAVWSLAQPAPPPANPPSEAAHSTDARWHPGDLQPALESAQQAKSATEQTSAAIRLARIPADQIPEAMASIPLVEGHRLTLAAKILLIRWGETDGDTAMRWAWEHLREQGCWEQAFHQVGPAWAWTDPGAFAAWLSRPPDAGTPQLGHSAYCRACEWLAPEAPLLATRLLLPRGGWSDSARFVHKLKTTTQVQEALTAFDALDQLSPWGGSSGPHLARQLLERWNQLDPEEFATSPYTSSLSSNAYQDIKDQTREWIQSPVADRADSANYILDASEPSDRRFHLYQLTHQWTESDPDATAAWITSLPSSDQSSALNVHTEVRATSSLQDTMTWIGKLPGAQQPACLVVAFDTWKKEPGAPRPDQSAWPEPLRRAWADLEALAPEPEQ